MTVTEQNIHDAVMRADDLDWLAGYLQGVVDSGFAVADLVALLETASLELRAQGNDASEALVLEGLDLLTGFCAPGRQIVPTHARAV